MVYTLTIRKFIDDTIKIIHIKETNLKIKEIIKNEKN
jgi:hypothetical protein